MNRLISRAYQEGEKEERISTLVDLVLDALEHDEYWTVCNELHEADRADVMHLLLLSQDAFKNRLLVEFKRPSHKVGRDDEGQAKKYADWLKTRLQLSVDIIVIGGTTDSSLCDEYSGKRTQFLSYAKLMADAQASLDWLLEQLSVRN